MESVFMASGKSYCFVTFHDYITAEKAYHAINGETIWSKIKGPIFLGFVNEFNFKILQDQILFKNPPGLILIDDFVTSKEEEFILNLIKFADGNEEEDTAEINYSSTLKHRKVKHYGYEFKYSTNNVDLSEPIEQIPCELDFLWERLRNASSENQNYIDFVPDQLTINCYEPGQGIPPHVDTHSAFEDGILSLSLQSSIVMEFKNESNISWNVILKRRSLCIMLGESRYDWTHGITPRKSDLIPNSSGLLTVQNRERRISLTFRKTRSGGCKCNYPRMCDTVLDKIKLSDNVVSDMRKISLKEGAASELEGNYVHGVYDKIAEHFSETRHKPWPRVLKFVNSFPTGSILVDVGCGNGKYFSKQTSRFELGCDSTAGLMKVCRQRGFECFSCNCLNLPLKDNVADGCICIAVIHHLTTDERRRRAIQEMIRVLRPKGRTLIYVWAKNQEIEGRKSSYLKQNNRKEPEPSATRDIKLEMVSLGQSQQELVLPVHNNRTGFGHNDLLVPWKLKKKCDTGNEPGNEPVFLRFYHVYENDELKKLCENLPGVKIIDYYYDQGNWCIILEKQ
ncbi:hypothetical protein RUM43_006401 [Polyplax serrata]|uniref:Fe2OG dioxygenase domain-containing protein n=1 Tax=Polyplax serrata TaxID=468196 RepID=A0AAN8S5F0_POLSC